MEKIEMTKDQLNRISKLLNNELDIDLSDFQTKILIEKITEIIGKNHYNKGVEDSIKYIQEKIDDLYSFISNA
jgi:uncharacterized protein (DUF2164 family)